MRTMIAAVIMTGIICIISACKTSETPMAKGNIGGDWTISEISGKKIVTPADAQAAFINIDAKKKQVNAYTGCNRFFGPVDLDTKEQTLSFDKVGATRMMCHDMTTENMLSEVLPKISRYGFSETGDLLLMKNEGAILVKLTKTPGK